MWVTSAWQLITHGGCGWHARARSWWCNPVWRLWWSPECLACRGNWPRACHHFLLRWKPARSGCRGPRRRRVRWVKGHCCQRLGLWPGPLQTQHERQTWWEKNKTCQTRQCHIAYCNSATAVGCFLRDAVTSHECIALCSLCARRPDEDNRARTSCFALCWTDQYTKLSAEHSLRRSLAGRGN